jgi:hypothetical protein
MMLSFSFLENPIIREFVAPSGEIAGISEGAALCGEPISCMMFYGAGERRKSSRNNWLICRRLGGCHILRINANVLDSPLEGGAYSFF